jgi:hypothetical protein
MANTSEDRLGKVEKTIERWTKEIAEKEGYTNIKIKFLSLYASGKKYVHGNCYIEKGRINFNKVLIPSCVFYFKNYKGKVWETMLHEIAHLKKIEDTNKLEFYKSSDLKEGEYIDWHHSISFWKYLRQLRKKYVEYKKLFYKELKEIIVN